MKSTLQFRTLRLRNGTNTNRTVAFQLDDSTIHLKRFSYLE